MPRPSDCWHWDQSMVPPTLPQSRYRHQEKKASVARLTLSTLSLAWLHNLDPPYHDHLLNRFGLTYIV